MGICESNNHQNNLKLSGNLHFGAEESPNVPGISIPLFGHLDFKFKLHSSLGICIIMYIFVWLLYAERHAF